MVATFGGCSEGMDFPLEAELSSNEKISIKRTDDSYAGGMLLGGRGTPYDQFEFKGQPLNTVIRSCFHNLRLLVGEEHIPEGFFNVTYLDLPKDDDIVHEEVIAELEKIFRITIMDRKHLFDSYEIQIDSIGDDRFVKTTHESSSSGTSRGGYAFRRAQIVDLFSWVEYRIQKPLHWEYSEDLKQQVEKEYYDFLIEYNPWNTSDSILTGLRNFGWEVVESYVESSAIVITKSGSNHSE